jgi:hypothetical protein
MKNTNQQPPRRKTQRFGGAAKLSLSMMATAAVIGGWNVIAHLDSAQADTTTSAENPAPAAPARGEGHAHRGRPGRHTLAPLTIPGVPALPPSRQGEPGAFGDTEAPSITLPDLLPDLPELAPLPGLPSLPSMPSMPSAPSTNSGGGVQSGGS